MMFEFNPGAKVDTQKWAQVNAKLRSDLRELVSGSLDESVVVEYLNEMTLSLRTVENGKCDEMLFLMFDRPESMPADARVEFVYLPTYLAATIMMTAVYRYEGIRSDRAIMETLRKVLNATLGRNFLGAGYEDNKGLMNTLEIFAEGDTFAFVSEYPEFNGRFTVQLVEAVTFLETCLCTGKVVEPWSGEPYSKKATEVLNKIRKN